MSYATPADIMLRYDIRRLGELVRDDGTRADATALATDANLQAALDDASGMIESAVAAGNRFVPSDLSGLTGNAAKFLDRITCDLAYGLLVQRRGFSSAEAAALAPGYAQALKYLEKLEQGDWIFPTSTALAAHIPVRVQLSTYPTLATQEASRAFGQTMTGSGQLRPRPNESIAP